jgi:hypothetical protein
VSFGKNRVQYHHQFETWMLYETENFITYWYGDARNVAQSALQSAELDFSQIQQLLEHQPTERIEMLVFSDLTDLKQSNVGEDEVFKLRSGETKVIGNKVFVYFDGNHNHLRAQIREGAAGVLLNSMLFGSNLQEIVQNAVLLNLPGWYTEGLTAYCGEEWNTQLDDEFRETMHTGRYTSFDKLAKDHPRLAGHAFWYYISLHFGRGTISNLLYLTRINRSIDAGFLYVLGGGYKRTTDALLEYFNKRYQDEALRTKAPETNGHITVKNKKHLPLYQIKVSPDGKRVAWVSNDIGKWRVWVEDRTTGKRTMVQKGGIRNALQATDYNYPQLAWNPDNQRLAILYERRDVVHLLQINLKDNQKETSDLAPDYQRVFSMDFINSIDLVFSAAIKGYSDLFIYHTKNRQTERITQDFWDDLDASVCTIDGHKGILFSSNRISDSLSIQKLDTLLPFNRFDVFYYDLETRNPELLRITQTPLADDRNPISLDSTHFTYLSDESGIYNRKIGKLEPYVAWNEVTYYLKNGSEVKALDTKHPGEWPQQRVLVFLAPMDTVLKNIDTTKNKIDSIRYTTIYKKRAKTWNQTNYDRNILEQHATIRAGKLAEAVYRDQNTQLYVRDVHSDPATLAAVTRYRELGLKNAGLPIPPQPPLPDSSASPQKNLPPPLPADDNAELRDSLTIIQPGWLFQVPDYLQTAPPPAAPKTEKPKQSDPNDDIVVTVMTADTMQPPIRRVIRTPGARALPEASKNFHSIRFNQSRIIPYRLKFRTDYISTSMDNNLLFEGLESVAGSPNGFRTPPPGVLLKANFKDLLEDYVIEAGFRLPTTFDGAEYYLWLDDKKKRIDKRYTLYRKTTVSTIDPPAATPNAPQSQVRTNTIMAQYELRYPFDAFFSLRATGTLRQDKAITLTTNKTTLDAPDHAEQRAAVRLSAVYDNTVDIDMNIRTGTRAKLYVEGVKRFDLNFQPNLSLQFNKGFMTVVGLDARHYIPLDRRTILAFRLAAATTFGSEHILYYLGGVDNWIFPKFNRNIPTPQNEDFAYQTLAANIRGFNQNIRNGNSYALLNTELRVPIFKYFSKKPVMGNFLRNFQLIGFFDVGTAWEGPNPYGGNNPINTVILTEGATGAPPIVTVKVNYFRDPLVAGYGFGARALIFGMYLRADYGWGIETKVIQKPILHIALGTDF